MFSGKTTLYLVISIVASAILSIAPPVQAFAILAAMVGLLPIFLFILLLPTISAYLLATITIVAVFAVFRVRSLLLSVPIATCLVGLSTWIVTSKVNETLEQRAVLLMSEDHDLVSPVEPISVLAVVEDKERSGIDLCTYLCQRALLNKSVDAIIMIRVESVAQTLNENWSGTLYRLRKQPTCPPLKGVTQYDDDIVVDKKGSWPSKTSADSLLIEAAQGNCLVAETVKLGDADAVIVAGTTKRGLQSEDGTLDPYADNASARRIRFLRRTASGYEEIYRSTTIEVQEWVPAILFFSDNYMQLSWLPRWVRTRKTLDVRPFARDIDSPLSFAQSRLGLDLQLDQDQINRDLRAVVSQAVNGGVSFPTVDDYRTGENVLSVFFRDMSQMSEIPAADMKLGLGVLAEPRIPLARGAQAAVRRIVTTNPAAADGVAASLFARLSAVSQPNAQMTSKARHQEVLTVVEAINSLPERAVLPYFDVLVSVSRNPDIWEEGQGAIEKLSLFGDEAVPALIDVIDRASQLNKATSSDGHGWQKPYMAALTALCIAGPKAKTALPQLQQRVQGETVAGIRFGWDLVRKTLTRLSADVPDTPTTKLELSRTVRSCSY